MIRSPPVLRSGSRSKVVPPSAPTADKKRSLSVSSAPELTMPNAGDKSNKPTIDMKMIESCINSHLSREDVFEGLVDRLSAVLRTVVEEAVKTAMVVANQQITDLREEVGGLRKKMSEYDEKLVLKCDELEQYQRRDNLRVFGVPEERDDDTDTLVLKLFRDKLNVELPAESLSRSHRVGRQPAASPDGGKRHRPIIVRFSSYRFRRLVFDAKKRLKGTGITIREDLTAVRQKLFQRAVELHGLRNAWTSDGRVQWVDKEGKKGVATRMEDIG